MIIRKHVPRRAFLRSAGAAIALPFLDSMTPALARPDTVKNTARLAFVYIPNGVEQQYW